MLQLLLLLSADATTANELSLLKTGCAGERKSVPNYSNIFRTYFKIGALTQRVRLVLLLQSDFFWLKIWGWGRCCTTRLLFLLTYPNFKRCNAFHKRASLLFCSKFYIRILIFIFPSIVFALLLLGSNETRAVGEQVRVNTRSKRRTFLYMYVHPERSSGLRLGFALHHSVKAVQILPGPT